MKTTFETHPALAETANELRSARKRAEDDNLAHSQARQKVRRRSSVQSRAPVSSRATKAQETWIGTRWYARSHPGLVKTAAVAVAVLLASAVSLAFLRED